MKEMLNKVTVQGVLVDTSLEVKADKSNKKFIAGEVEIMTDEDYIVPVSCFSYELKKNGDISKAYENLNKIANKPTVREAGSMNAGRISLSSGRLEDNMFYSERENKVVNSWKIGGMFFNNAAQDAASINEFEVEGIVNSIKEIVANDGESTGVYDLKLLTVGYGDRVSEISLKFKDPDAVNYITTSYNTGDKVVLSGKVIYEVKEKTVEKETAFGKPIVNTYTNTSKTLLITAGSEPVSAEEHGIKIKTLQTKMKDRQKDVEEKYEARSQKDWKETKASIDKTLF